MGLFALKPLKLSRNRKELTVSFFGPVPGNHGVKSQIDWLLEPTSPEGLEVGRRRIYFLKSPEE
jgi:hypothetical protein